MTDSKLDTKILWSHIKTIKLKYLIKNSELACENGFIPEENILINLESLSQILKINSSQETNRILSKSEIKLGAEMFMSLNSCPSFFIRLYWKAIYGPKSRIAMLASNIMKKGELNFKIKAMKIFAKISSVLGFKHMSYNHNEYKNFDKDIILTKNVDDIEGEKHLCQKKYFNIFPFTDKALLQTVSNHPVHILNNEGKFTTSSFIPFCSFGKTFIGDKVNEFDIPVCNIFLPRIHFDQLCFETDIQKLKDSKKIEDQLEMGLTLVLDYNEERQIDLKNAMTKNESTK